VGVDEKVKTWPSPSRIGVVEGVPELEGVCVGDSVALADCDGGAGVEVMDFEEDSVEVGEEVLELLGVAVDVAVTEEVGVSDPVWVEVGVLLGVTVLVPVPVLVLVPVNVPVPVREFEGVPVEVRVAEGVAVLERD
jgi:hypothetical protein